MSHFTVLVTGNNPENQLEPFSENLKMAPYVISDVKDEDKQSFLNTYRTYNPKRTYAQLSFEEVERNKLRTFEELYNEYGNDWNDNSWEIRDGEWVEISTRNPNSKWDWYVRGGRWDGFLYTKPRLLLPYNVAGFSAAEVDNFVQMYNKDKDKFMRVSAKYAGKAEELRKDIASIAASLEERASGKNAASKVNSAYKRDVSFEAKSNDHAQKAREEYIAVQSLFPDGMIPTIEHSWESLGDVYSDVTERRNAYRSQNSVVLWAETIRNADNTLRYHKQEDFQCSIEEYVKRAYDAANVTFAVLHEGKWYERGEMGWRVMVHNEKSDWNVEFNNLIKGLPDHTLLTVFDCHI